MSRFFVATVAARPAPVSFDIEISDETALEKFNADKDFAIGVIAEKYLLSGACAHTGKSALFRRLLKAHAEPSRKQ
jgi:hypothetical protein